MALRMLEGFDHVSLADIGTKWGFGNFGGNNITTGRYGGSALNTNDPRQYCLATFDNQATWIIGFAYQPNGFAGDRLCSFFDGATRQMELRYINNDGRLQVQRNGTTLATSTTYLVTGIWVYIEFKVTIHGSTGTYEVRVNGVNVLSATGQNTSGSGNAYANQVQLQGASTAFISSALFDDVYICDGSGSANNDFLGEVRVQTLFPSGAGNTTQLTPSTGANYAAVDENPQNGDTDYVSSATATQKDTYAYGDLAASTASVLGVQTTQCSRKDDVGARAIVPVVRSGGSDYDGASQGVNSSYGFARTIFETNPATGVAFTVAGVNGAEFGLKVA